MAKDKLWFTHDLNARNDRKIAPLVKEYKSAGYGVFWCAVEMMHEEGGSLEFDAITFSAIAKDLNEEADLVEQIIAKCVNVYKLFKISENVLISNRVSDNISEMEESRKNKSRAGRASAAKRREQKELEKSTGVQQVFNDCSTGDEQNPTQTNKQTVLSLSVENKELLGYLEEVESFKDLSDEEKKETCMLIQEMLSVYQTKRPDYFPCKDVDYPALLLIAYQLGDFKKWKKAEIVAERKGDLLKSWGAVLDYIFSKDWVMKDKTLQELYAYGNFHTVLNKMVQHHKKQEQETEKVIGPRILSSFKAAFPDYYLGEEDGKKAAQIAFHIAKANGWPTESVANGKMELVLGEWDKLIEVIRSDQWFLEKTISDFTSVLIFQKLYQAYKNPRNGTKTTKQSSNGSFGDFKPGRTTPNDQF